MKKIKANERYQLWLTDIKVRKTKNDNEYANLSLMGEFSFKCNVFGKLYQQIKDTEWFQSILNKTFELRTITCIFDKNGNLIDIYNGRKYKEDYIDDYKRNTIRQYKIVNDLFHRQEFSTTDWTNHPIDKKRSQLLQKEWKKLDYENKMVLPVEYFQQFNEPFDFDLRVMNGEIV